MNECYDLVWEDKITYFRNNDKSVEKKEPHLTRTCNYLKNTLGIPIIIYLCRFRHSHGKQVFNTDKQTYVLIFMER